MKTSHPIEAPCSLINDLTGSLPPGIALQYSLKHSESLSIYKFRLDNGLTLLIARDLRVPNFCYQSWFGVGSRHEIPGKTGLAHLLEHLMFRGTKRFPAGELDRRLEALGAETNAGTWLDWTYYTQTLASSADNLELIGTLEADRMRNLVFESQSFEAEREIVLNEYYLSVENQPYSQLLCTLNRAVFGAHPYGNLTIGEEQDIKGLTQEITRSFYKTYYTPENATVIIAGALELGETLQSIHQHYGKIQTESILTKTPLVPPPEPQKAHHQTIQLNTTSPLVAIGYLAVSQTHENFASLRLLDEILNSGESGRLYRRFVLEEQLAVDCGGSLLPSEDAGIFEFNFQMAPGKKPETLIRGVQELLDTLEEWLTERDLERARNQLEMQFHLDFLGNDSICQILGHHEMGFGDFRKAFSLPQRLAKVERKELVQIAKKLLAPHRQTSVVGLPKQH